MKLYYSAGACSLAVRITLHEIGLSFDEEAVNLQDKTTASGSNYLSINPKGSVPMLQLEDNQLLSENSVIQQYLADHYQAVSLLPPLGNIDRYRVLEWLNFVSTDLHKGVSPLFSVQLPEAVKASVFRPLVKNKLKFVNNHLEKNKYLFNNQFTLADSYLFVVLRWMDYLKVDIDDLKNIERYVEEIKQRPSIQKALAEENLI